MLPLGWSLLPDGLAWLPDASSFFAASSFVASSFVASVVASVPCDATITDDKPA